MTLRSLSRRILAVWLPWWATERLTRHRPEVRERPFVTVSEVRGRMVVDATNLLARKAGLSPGMPLADARAVEPDVVAIPADPAGDLQALQSLGRWAFCFTPRVVPSPPDTLFLDVGGCAHLFGGEEALATKVREALNGFGLASRTALAGTPGAAWALSHYGSNGAGGTTTALPPVAGPDGTKDALADLPVAALRLEPGVAEALSSFGLDRIRALFDMESVKLDARFGSGPSRRLAQALGHLEEPLAPLRPPAPLEACRTFAEPIARASDIRAAVDDLLASLCRTLRRTEEGVRRLRLICRGVDGTRQSLVVGTSRPRRRREALAPLFAEKLDQVRPGFGIEEMVLRAEVVEAVEAVQRGWIGGAGMVADYADAPTAMPDWADSTPGRAAATLDWAGATPDCADATLDWAGATPDCADAEGLAGLLDRIGNRFGFGCIVRPWPRQSWLPERAVGKGALSSPAVPATCWPEGGRRRPLRLLSPPEPVDVRVDEPRGPPVFFVRRRQVCRVRTVAGPERLECEWWREDAPPRDYYWAEDDEGQRYWLYREEQARWFLHGLFG